MRTLWFLAPLSGFYHWFKEAGKCSWLKYKSVFFVQLSKSRLDLNFVILCKVGIFRVKKFNELLNLGWMIAKNNSTHFFPWLIKVEIEENMWFCKVSIITVVHSDSISFISSILKKIQPLFFKQFYPFSSEKKNKFSPFSLQVSQ